MRLLHLRWDHLPLLLEHHAPALPGHVVLGGRPWDPGTVLDASPAALRAGVIRGQALGAAHALVPDALFLEPHRARYRHAMETALETLVAVTPAVEGVTDPDDPAFGRVLLGIEGLERLWGDEAAVVVRARATAGEVLPGEPRVGIGNTRFGAQVAAALRAVIPIGDASIERTWLASRPIRCLTSDPDTLGRLRRFGLTCVGEFAVLPRSAVVARFGERGGSLHDLANGLDARPLRPRRPVERLRAQLEPEPPIDGVEPLRFILHHLCDGLCRQLAARGAAVNRVVLSLTLEDAPEPSVVIEQHLPEPVARPEAIERLLVARLETLRPGGRIGRVALELDGRQPGAGRQLGLFEPQGARADRFAWELAALAIRFPGQLWRTSVVDPRATRTEERSRWEPVEVPEGVVIGGAP